jgi:hypothetical protein
MVLATLPETTPVQRQPLALIDNNLYACGVLNLGKISSNKFSDCYLIYFAKKFLVTM